MSTTFFPTNTASTATTTDWTHSPTVLLLSLTRGAGAQTVTDNTIALLSSTFGAGQAPQIWGNANTQTIGSPACTDLLAGSLVFVTNPLNAVSIVGGSTLTTNIRALESNAMANYGPGCTVYKMPANGGSCTFIGGTGVPTEYGTTEAAFTPAVIHASTVALADGDRLVVFFGHVGVGSSASGFTASGFYAGASGATGDTFITFNETITEQVIAAQVPYVNPMPPFLAQ